MQQDYHLCWPADYAVFDAKLLQHGLLSPQARPQVLPEACSSISFPQGHSLLLASNCSGVEFSRGWRWVSAPSLTFTGTACLTMVFTTGCCSGTWDTSSSCFNDLGVCSCLSHIFLFQMLLQSNFFPFLNITEVLPTITDGLSCE